MAVSLVGHGYNEDSDSEDARAKSRAAQSALSEDDSDDENGPVSRPGRLNLEDYSSASSAELFARLNVKARGSFNKDLVTQRSFNNPHVLNSIVKKFKIDQYGTGYPKEAYSPKDVTELNLCYTFLSEKVIEFERKKALKEKEKKEGAAKEESPAPVDRKRPSKWSEAVKAPVEVPMPLIPGLGLPLTAAAVMGPSLPGQFVAGYNPLQQAITIAARLKTLTHKPAAIPPTAPAPAYVPTSAATAAAVAAAAVAARERAAKANSVAMASINDEEINRKRQAALQLLRESAEKKRKQQGG